MPASIEHVDQSFSQNMVGAWRFKEYPGNSAHAVLLAD
jgi:hypothetical protein